MAEPENETKKKKTSSLLAYSVSKLHLSPSATKGLKPDWSLLPEELLQLISTHLEKKNRFFVDAIHARSVCTSWRSTFDFPACLLRPRYSLPWPYKHPTITSFTLEKIPLFLFRVQTQTPPETPPPPSEYFLGGISKEDHHHTENLPFPLQCSVKAKFSECNQIFMNVLDCQIHPLRHHYKIMGTNPEYTNKYVAFLPLNKEEDEFVVLLHYPRILLMLRSSEMKWMRVTVKGMYSLCKGIITFRGKFYAVFDCRNVFVIDPLSPTEATPLIPSQDHYSQKFLIPSSDDKELFLVERINTTGNISAINRLPCTVSKLDEEAGAWIQVNDLGDQVLIIGLFGNVAVSSKHLPDGCGLSGNSVLLTNLFNSNVTFAYKYDDLGFWRLSGENRVLIRNNSRLLLALMVDRVRNPCFL